MVSRFARASEAKATLELLYTGREEIPLRFKGEQSEYLDWMRGHCVRRCVRVIDSDNELAAVMVLLTNKIQYLVVGPSFRRRGLASELIEYAKRRWKRRLFAKVNPANSAIIATLLKEGFRRDGTYDEPNWDAYSWSKPSREKGR